MIQNSHWGPTLESFLEEAGMLEEANAYATEKILAWQISEARKEQEISQTDLDRQLDPENGKPIVS